MAKDSQHGNSMKHIYETLADGSRICFECDHRKPNIAENKKKDINMDFIEFKDVAEDTLSVLPNDDGFIFICKEVNGKEQQVNLTAEQINELIDLLNGDV